MRSPISILFAICGLLAVGWIVWRADEPPSQTNPSENELSGKVAPTKTPPEGAVAATFPPSSEEALSRLFPAPLISLNREAVAALFALEPETTVLLPLPGAPQARVTMKHRHGTGALSLGLRIEGETGATLYLTQSSRGVIEGHLTSPRSRSAFRLDPTAPSDPLRLRRIAVDDLLCARFEEGRLQPGFPPEPESAEADDGGADGPEESVPLLESRPSSARVIYLNFEGETVVGTPWNVSYTDGDPIVAAPFGTPGHIPGIWASLAEDYAIFDVNVTTERADFENAAPEDRVMVLFTPTKSWYGSAGGVAYLDSFGSETNPYAWVFNLTLNGSAESAAHEIGHTLGLRHDGSSSRSYYTGHTHASGVSWAPIMGTGYGKTIVQFSKGEYPGANRTENDLVLIAEFLDPLPDDHGHTAATATDPAPVGDGAVEGAGLIGNAEDRDLFRIVTGGSGTITATAAPASAVHNLDLGLELLDDSLTVLADAAPVGPFDATLSLPSLPAGTYYLRVRGTGLGDLVTGYSAYGSVGGYHLEASFPPAPLPDPPALLSASDGTSTDFVSLAWGPVPLASSYRVYRGLASDGSDAALIASPTGPTQNDTTAEPGTTYFYFVAAFNASGESPRSSGESGWRQRLAPDTPTSISASTDSPHSIRIAWLAAERAQQYRLSRNAVNSFAGSTVLGTTSSLSWHDTTTAPGEAFYYFVESLNTGGTSAAGGCADLGIRTPLPPGTPTGLSASDGVSATQTHLTWIPGIGATGYRVYRNTVESVAGATEIAVLGETTSWADTGGSRGAVYWYFVRAILSGGDSAPSNLETGHRLALPPGAPATITATRGSHSGGVLVSWSATDDTETYEVFRGNEADPGSAEFLGETTDPEWLDDTAAPGRTYRYFVRSANTAGLSAYSTPVLGYDAAPDPSDDSLENNDDVSESVPLAQGETAAIAVVGDPDWYAITLDPGESRIDLAVPFESSRGTVLLVLCDESGALVASATAGKSSRVLTHTGIPGASYRVLIECDEGTVVPYRLLVSSLAESEHGLLPDGAIGVSFPPRLGEMIYNQNASGQTLRLVKRGAGSRICFASLTNRSAVAGGFVIRGRSDPSRIELRYFTLLGGHRVAVTGAVTSRGLRRSLAPFDTSQFSISVRVPESCPRRSERHTSLPIALEVAGDPATRDLVRCHLLRLRRLRR